MQTGGAINPFSIDQAIIKPMLMRNKRPSWHLVARNQGILVHDLLSADEVRILRNSTEHQAWQPVGLDGIANHYQEGDPIGSWRMTSDSPELAELLWQRLREVIGTDHTLTSQTPTDHGGHQKWKATGINPRLRFIRYLKGGLLVPHYDAPYQQDNDHLTLMTVVIYLGKTGEATGGATRFITDPQQELSVQERNLSDWTRAPTPEEIITRIDPPAGSALLFWHRILHDSEPLSGEGDKTIIRTDVMFQRA